jgi:LacI family transcriptional regulator
LGCGQLDGVIVALAAVGAPILQRLQESHRPCVVVGHRPNYPDIPWLDVDNMAGAKSMTEHLISLGHRRIATIMGSLNSIAGHDRLDGYRLALAQAGIAGDGASLGRRFYRRERLLCDEASHAHSRQQSN